MSWDIQVVVISERMLLDTDLSAHTITIYPKAVQEGPPSRFERRFVTSVSHLLCVVVYCFPHTTRSGKASDSHSGTLRTFFISSSSVGRDSANSLCVVVFLFVCLFLVCFCFWLRSLSWVILGLQICKSAPSAKQIKQTNKEIQPTQKDQSQTDQPVNLCKCRLQQIFQLCLTTWNASTPHNSCQVNTLNMIKKQNKKKNNYHWQLHIELLQAVARVNPN